jgi:hypothetical protein
MASFRVTVPFLRGPGSVVGVAGLAILFGNYRGARPKQELLPHLSEARTAKFAVILADRLHIKRATIANRRLQHQLQAA